MPPEKCLIIGAIVILTLAYGYWNKRRGMKKGYDLGAHNERVLLYGKIANSEIKDKQIVLDIIRKADEEYKT